MNFKGSWRGKWFKTENSLHYGMAIGDSGIRTILADRMLYVSSLRQNNTRTYRAESSTKDGLSPAFRLDPFHS